MINCVLCELFAGFRSLPRFSIEVVYDISISLLNSGSLYFSYGF